MERPSAGKIDRIIKNKFARATAVVALTFAAAHAVNTQTAEAQTPYPCATSNNLLKDNCSFETVDPGDSTKPQLWNRIYLPDTDILDTYDSGIALSGTKSVSAKLSCTNSNNGWKNEQQIAIDTSKKYEFKYSSKYSRNSSGTTSMPDTLIEFYNASGGQIGSYVKSTVHTQGENTWEQFVSTIGPVASGADKIYPPLTAKVRVGFLVNGTKTGSCVPTTGYIVETFDDVSFSTPSSVGGILEEPDPSLLQEKVDSKKGDDISRPLEAVAVVVGLTATAGVAIELNRRRRAAK